MMQLLKLFVEFTPTEKDDAALAALESFLVEHPEFLPLIFRILRAKL